MINGKLKFVERGNRRILELHRDQFVCDYTSAIYIEFSGASLDVQPLLVVFLEAYSHFHAHVTHIALQIASAVWRGNSIKTDLRPRFMKTVRFSR